MSERLPEWVEVGAEAILTWGLRGEHVERMSVTRVTPSGQVVVTGSSRGERRFMLRDFQKDGTAHRYVGGAFPASSLYLYPLSHPKVPLLIAKREYVQAWSRVERTMNRLREAETGRTEGDPEQYVDALIEQLATWRQAKVNLSDLS